MSQQAPPRSPPPYIPDSTTPVLASFNLKSFYWIYWGTCYFTVVTWIFAVSAASQKAWATVGGYNFGGLDTLCSVSSVASIVGYDDACSKYKSAVAFQILATITISCTLLIIGVATFKPAPVTGQLGLAVGITLGVFSFFELIAFSLGASYVSALDEIYSSFSVYYEISVTAGPTLGVAVTAWIFGVVGTIVIVTLRSKATADQDGPCRKFVMPEQQDSVPPAATQQPSPAKSDKKGPPPAFTEDTV